MQTRQTRTALVRFADRLQPGEEIITETEVSEMGLDIAPSGYRSDDELKLAARRGLVEDYHG